MSRRAISLTRLSTFEEERKEAIECALCGTAERPGDRITRSACDYLLRHLAHEAPERGVQG